MQRSPHQASTVDSFTTPAENATTPPAPAPHAPHAPLVHRVLDRVSKEVGLERFHRYFEPPTRVSMEGGVLDIAVPSGFVADVLSRRFGENLRRAASAESEGGEVSLRIHVDESVAPRAATPAPAARPVAPAPAPARRKPAVGAAALRHRLDEFVVGESNRVAFGASIKLVEPEGSPLLGPLFIHGPCGVGKTHLLQGVASRYLERHPGATVKYTTAESFTNEYIQGIRSGSIEGFRRAYRSVDLLCLDDVHFLSNKESTQRELLHTFDAVGLGGARIVLASDEHPADIRSMSRQLLSRFIAGAVVKIDAPEAALRERLVRHVAVRRGLEFDDAAVGLIADRAARGLGPGMRAGSVRDIEGLLTQVEATRLVMPELAPTGRIGLVLVRRALSIGGGEGWSDSGKPRPRRPIPVQHIASEVCRTLGVPLTEFVGRGRHRAVVLAREMTVLIARRLTTCSFPEIAQAMGRENHSTVLTAHKRLEAKVKAVQSPEFDVGGLLSGLTLDQIADRLTDQVVRSDG